MTFPTSPSAELDPLAKRALLAELLHERLDATRVEAALTHGQQAMWFLHQLAPESGAYNVAFAARVRSAVDHGALQRALQALVDRHASLRTTYGTRDGKPVQLIAARQNMELKTTDAATWDETTLYHQLNTAFRAPFDLEQGPLFRATLYMRGLDDHVLLLTAHHIAIDAWSVWVLLHELGEFYAAETTGSGASLPPLAIQYSDYARWQNALVAGNDGERMWDYWRTNLSGDLPVLDLPTDRARPALQTFEGATIPFEISDKLSERLRAFARSEQTTPFVVMLAAYQVLLHRYSGQDDILVGSPMAGRNRPEFAGLVGDFINTVVLRADLSGAPTFRALVAQVRGSVLSALEHQEFPFALLVQRLAPKPDPSRSPVFQAGINFHNLQRTYLADLFAPDASGVRVDVGGLLLESYPIQQQEGQFDLMLQIIDANTVFVPKLQYNTNLFDAATIERMASHYGTLLEAAILNPDDTVDALPMLNERERAHLLGDWSNVAASSAVSSCVHEVFEAQAARTPDAVAVTWEDEHLSYATLNGRANQLARHLRAHGIVDETPTALLLDRTPAMVVAILAVLKAGGAYVPLDSTYPTERLDFMLEDCGATIVLTQENLVDRISRASESEGRPAMQVIRIDVDWNEIEREAEDDINLPLAPEQLAYVIYTSGSTGKPKGVMVTHANVVRLFTATQPWYNFGHRDVWSLFHSYAFDFSVWEMWGALLHGGRLVIVSHAASRSPEAFYNLLAREQVTVLNQTPSAFRQLMRTEEIPGLATDLHLRLVIFGGEALDIQSLRPWFARHGDARPRLVNMYGITETTVHVTYRPMTLSDLDNAAGSLIGSPIPDLQVYVLDGRGEPAPIGVPGELCIGGAGVARGYLNRPELTAQRFVQNPYSRDAEARLYRSGDLARYLDSGDLEYLGRIDFQVKIRGFRVELGEIEAVIGQHSGIREVAVLARTDGGSSPKLVAYLTMADTPRPTPGAMRAFLKARLPDYMIPAAFVFLEAFPLTDNGKLDRRALPDPSQQRADLGDGYVAPQSPTEVIVSTVWSTILGIDRVGVYDNFFDLGGHSLQLVEVLAAMEQKLGVRVSPALAQTQTLGQLAATCDELIAKDEVRGPSSATSVTQSVFGAMRRVLGAGPRQGAR